MKYTLTENSKGKLEVEFCEGEPFIHLELFEWSIESYKLYKRIWETVKKKFKYNGTTRLWVLIPDDDPKLLKFEKMFGFKVLEHKDNAYLMVQEL